jgi:uncharacterized membrane-anchored protein YjiN (DUF445 family)
MYLPSETQQQLDQAEHDVQRLALRQMQQRALALLLAAVALLVLAHLMRQQSSLWGYVAAFSEAAIVGAMADWFAVVALFRHPLGLPIWHTAIIPQRKGDIGRSLGRFVETHFVTEDGIAQRIRQADPAQHIGTWLLHPQHSAPLGQQLAGALQQVLGSMDQQAIRQAVRELATQRLAQIDLSANVGQLVDMLMVQKKHQDLLNAVLDGMGSYLGNADNQPAITQFMLGSLGGDNALVKMAINSLAPKAITSLGQTLAAVRQDEVHAFRARFDGWMSDFTVRLKADPAWQGQIRQHQMQLLHDPQTQALLDGLWDSLMQRLMQDLGRSDSAVALHLQGVLEKLGRLLLTQSELRDGINAALEQAGRAGVRKYRGAVGHFIEQQLALWSPQEMAERIELAVGRDLQFIRINGTLVGGLIGLLIYALTQVLA